MTLTQNGSSCPFGVNSLGPRQFLWTLVFSNALLMSWAISATWVAKLESNNKF
jgi:hypothetical protein